MVRKKETRIQTTPPARSENEAKPRFHPSPLAPSDSSSRPRQIDFSTSHPTCNPREPRTSHVPMLRPSRTRRPLSLALALGLAASPGTTPLPAQQVAEETVETTPPAPTEAAAPTEAPAFTEAPPPAEAPVEPAVIPPIEPPIEAIAPEEMVGPMVFRETPLDQILELVERWTGRTLLRPSTLPLTNYTLTLDKALPKSEALRALETLLSMNGIGLSPLGDRFIRATPINLIRSETPEFIEGSTLGLPPSGRIASKLFTLDFLRAAEFVPQISALLNQALQAGPIIFEKNNSVLLIDSVANLQRIEQLLVALDRPAAAGLSLQTYNIVNAKASDLTNQLRTLLSGPLQAQIGTATVYQPDDRTNQIILISDPRERPFFDEIIARLDSEASPNTRSEVIFLKHANATDVATLLGQLVTGQTTASSREGGSSSGRSGRRLSGNDSPPPNEGAAVPATPAAVVENAAASEEFSSFLTIVADERSNAIVVAGTPNDIKLVASLVDRIDVLLAQVRLEVVIAEVTIGNDYSSGISSLGLDVQDNKLVGFSVASAGLGVGGSAGTDGAPSGFATIDSLGGSAYDLSGIVRLSSSGNKNSANILQTPSVTTTHNKEAEIFVGETRPVISGTTSSNVNADTTSSTVTQQEIGVRLKVLPLIGSSGNVQLEIETEVEDVLGTVIIDGNEQPRIGRRTTTSYVSARNGDIIVLGGLQRASQSRTSNRLGPIPIIGDILGARSRSKGRTELIFFLRPTVLTNTQLDNVEALRRIDSTPQAKQVRQVLETRNASAPEGEPLPPPLTPAPPAEDTRRPGPAGKR
jgi:general secretion pathway protein D